MKFGFFNFLWNMQCNLCAVGMVMGIIMTFESWIIVVVRFNVLVCLFVIEGCAQNTW